MKNKHLVKAAKLLPDLFTYFKQDDVLVIAEDKASLPFAYVIVEENNYPDNFLISLAVGYFDVPKLVNLTLMLNKIKEVKLVDGFFISQTGNTYLGEEAEKYQQLEFEIPIKEIDPESDTIH